MDINDYIEFFRDAADKLETVVKNETEDLFMDVAIIAVIKDVITSQQIANDFKEFKEQAFNRWADMDPKTRKPKNNLNFWKNRGKYDFN